jgi:hypothetical protein
MVGTETKSSGSRLGNLSIIVGLACAFLASGCAILTACRYETRFVRASGQLIENSDTTVGANVHVDANRGSIELKYLDWMVGGTLKGHVTSIALVDAGNPSGVRVPIPVDPPSSSFIAAGNAVQRGGETSPSLGGVYEVVGGNRAALEILTDIPSRPTISLPLRRTEIQDWYRPHDCY